ncbi:hypothetical protein BVH01_14665 [Pseudomonas sp. PA1(2017)]|uniref:N-acetylneuraminate synthase family protein n=1 Tax=Pseudomonas sp. PA1(2017) TaxID=1932113 RepID=UPI00096284B9|nr:N-acetylneuraminate synthase family protein [Pseudomonas sp. PA1(2017)]OLU15086.1 hypothetical protein BVH01_14665 [Pseudomonas sp. PA1(2017)]
MQIGTRQLGEDKPVFIVAEIGANHDGDPVKAAELVRMAARAGVDAVKFQTYTAAELVADADRVVSWGRPGQERQETIGGLFDRLALPRAAHGELFALAKSLGVLAFSTPFSPEGADFLDCLQVPCFKVAASDVAYLDLLERVARSGKPVILSLGKSTLAEAERAVAVLNQAGCRDLVLLHCLSAYPAPDDEMNLRTITTLRHLFPQASIGLSDHSLGYTAALGSVALGARLIEKHITLDRDTDGPDHWFSAEETELTALVRETRRLEVMLGRSYVGVRPSEVQERRVSTRSLVLRHALPAGHRLTLADLAVLRPGYGIHPFERERVLGRQLARGLPAMSVLGWDDIGA